MIHRCAQRGCSFDVADVVIPAKLEADGVTVSAPERVEPGASPALCPVCGHPFAELERVEGTPEGEAELALEQRAADAFAAATPAARVVALEAALAALAVEAAS